ncbi:FMN-binding glutamate synthase family protein [Francisella philomiragia]|uniref:FMN-binding glutamate synthase family protein n=1 Tax=Francisella philomiragia TaxID=28110 RepID=UPI001907A51B|nr:FMN-binding glutamate synthase family protein [Francisella philomiragia]MBK2268285.1 FMN-binding glutamate synthase family protein [Francisella philomiragia]MBK2279720.1 FMN-binding glutamate synthase family protein [Francisella philomiragia]MBK2287596.1 FMN-binding glutamate synthase family protein [Francisella philomiragia]MBK2289575.1 FMN-binding glutamate synthase family protein [Francisella philomiragia]MBK2291473.1 FMN-binding glutamate synthase family protein [Francisella philomiragi
MHISERRKWYIGFAVFVIIVLLSLSLLHASIWVSIGFIAVLAVIAIYDTTQTKHAILRNFPIVGHMRFILEFIRPEIQQYFIADNESEKPFGRETRSTIYRRAKGLNDTVAFGTEKDIDRVGYEWVTHSLVPKHLDEVETRVKFGGSDCKQPYMASHLNISAMSFGALSANAIMALNKGAKLGEFCHCTGEGGLTKYHLQGGDIVFQIGTAYFGCRTEDGNFSAEKFAEKANLDSVKMIEIKLSQGAKPSHGGVLPAAKITPEIAEIRGVSMGKDVLSPPAHSAFSTPIEFCHFIKQLRDLSNGKPIGFKLCIGSHVEFLAICKAMLETGIKPDFITVDGAAGGTGAAPLEFSNHIGMPLEDSLIFVHNALVGCGLRDEIRIVASSKVATGFDMVRLFAMGADTCNSARAMMMAVGCIQSRQCNNNTCPVGVATQNERLAKALVVEDKMYRVYNFHKATINSCLEIVGAMGLTSTNDIGPENLKKRVSVNEIKSYIDLYDFIPENSLIDGNMPASFARSWEKARADSF